MTKIRVSNDMVKIIKELYEGNISYAKKKLYAEWRKYEVKP